MTDFERRFGGMRRLFGSQAAQSVFDAHAVVVGLGGVGSWAAEALARSGIGKLTLIDMDHIAESNINRQVHALSSTIGQSKVQALGQRIAQIHPTCQLQLVDDFVTPENWASMAQAWLTSDQRLGVIDACDQSSAKAAMAGWALAQRTALVTVGAAGGKRWAQETSVDDLARVTHDPLLAKLRYALRRHHGATRDTDMGVTCVFSREAVAPPDPSCGLQESDHSLNCHGFGSLVSVTASFGLCAAGWLINTLAQPEGTHAHRPQK